MKNLLVCLLLVMLVGVTFATQPTIYGYSGIFTAPTAETIKTAGVALIGSTSKDVNTVGGCVGLFPNWELSAARVSNSESQTILSGKILLLQEGLALPAIGVGVADITDEIGSSVYVVATKTLTVTQVATKTTGLPFGPPQISAGIASGKIMDGVFAGVVLPLSGRSRIMAEYSNKKVNLGLAMQVLPLVEVEVFTLEGNVSGAVYVKLGF
ncbi:YjbH domain-containing protein [bacterium]|nr:YjbH domain-containing protein [bacterium]